MKKNSGISGFCWEAHPADPEVPVLCETAIITLDLIATLDLPVPPSPNLQVATTSDAGLTLSWDALMGRAYQVQFKADLTHNSWRNLGSRITATNTTMSATHSTVSNPQRFYRVSLLPRVRVKPTPVCVDTTPA